MNNYQKRFPPPPMLRDFRDEIPAPAPSSFVDIVLRRKGTIALFALGSALFAFGVTAPQTKLYRAHTSIEFAGLNDNLLNSRDVDPTATGDNASQLYINTQVRVLQSLPLLKRVVNRVKPAPGQPVSERKKQALQYLTPRSLSADIQVRAGEASRLVDVYVESSDPELAADLANAMATEYMALNVEARMGSTKQTAEWLTQQMTEVRSKLEASEAAVQSYARKSNLVFTHEDGSVAEARLRDLQDDYSKAQADRVSKQATYEGLLAESAEAVNASLKDPALQEYQLKLSELDRQLADLSTTYQPTNRRVQRVKSQIDDLKRDYAKQHDSALNRVRNDYDTAKRREEMLRGAYLGQQGAVTAEASKAVDYNMLKREAETNRSIYEGMLQKVKAYGIVSAMQPSNTRVIDPAEPPTFPYKPNVPLMTVFGLMGGAFFGLVWVGVRDKGEINIEYPGQTNTVLQTNELGVIPSARLDPYLKGRGKQQLTASGRSGHHGNDVTLHKRMETAMWFCKSSLTAESVRSIRTSLLANQTDGARSQVLVITSMNPGHGKTSTVSNLGIAYAELGKSVLIIDGDVRSPGLHKIFGLSNEAGLISVLQNPKPLNQNELPLQDTGVPYLSILTSGPFTSGTSSTSLFHSQRMLDLLRHLRSAFEIILIDTPPLTLADARVLGPLADGVVLVLRAGDVRMDSVLAAEERLTQDGCQIVGTVLNDWDPRSNGYGVYPERYHENTYFNSTNTN